MSFIGTPFENRTLRWALLVIVLIGLILFTVHLAGWTAAATLALNPQPEPPGLV